VKDALIQKGANPGFLLGDARRVVWKMQVGSSEEDRRNPVDVNAYQGTSFQSVFPGPMAKIADRIEVNPDVHHGKPVIAGTRVPVHMVLGLLGEGRSVDEILDEYYDHITREDVLACIRYAYSVLEEEVHAGCRQNDR
jgi:uncharacterized protein (DUF433 family)